MRACPVALLSPSRAPPQPSKDRVAPEQNPTPIFLSNGSTVLLYKGRGSVQAMGAARAPRYDGPFARLNPAAPVLSASVEDTWGWVQPAAQ